MNFYMGRLVVSTALLLSGINIVPATTTLVANVSQPTQDDFYLGSTFIQPFTTGGAASLNTLYISSSSGWTAENSPTIALLDSGSSLVASFVYSAISAGGVAYTLSAPSNALQAASTYFIQVSGGAGYLNVTTSLDQTGLPSWTIGDLSYRGSVSASTTSSQILQFSLSGVPEPATSSLLVIGLGLFTLARRRSRA